MEGREGSSSSSAGQTPKKKGFDPSIFLKPIADFPTSAGKIYLFSLRVSDLLQFEKLAANEPLPKFRNFLPYIASLSPNAELEKNRESLTSELVAQLSDEEVEAIAEPRRLHQQHRAFAAEMCAAGQRHALFFGRQRD